MRKTRRSHRDAVLDEVRQYGADGRFRRLNSFSAEDLDSLIVVGKRIAANGRYGDDARWALIVPVLQMAHDAVTKERVESVWALSHPAHERIRIAAADAWVGEEPVY